MAIKKIMTILTISIALIFSACSQEPLTQPAPEKEVEVTIEEESLRENATISQEEEMIQKVVSLENGLHDMEITYQDPAGENLGMLMVFVQDGMIMDINIEIIEGSPASFKHAQSFNEEARELLMNKNINELDSEMIIGGASLTSKAFYETFTTYLNEQEN